MTVGSPSTNRSLLDFIHHWQGSKLTERSSAHSHFNDLCDVLGERRPTDVDQEGTTYTFERGVAKSGGGPGFADVWKRGYFAWEYKTKGADLAAAYRQLLNYQEDLENPPLLVVCDMDRFEVHTRFTNMVTKVYEFRLADLADPLAVSDVSLSALNILRAVFGNPDALRPKQTTAQVTQVAAREFAQLASSLHRAGVQPEPAAHFLMRLLFCLFAQDIQLLPSGLFTRLVTGACDRPADFAPRVRGLFAAMATGDAFGEHDIAHFNGGLFADDRAFDLSRDDLAVLARCCQLNWASIEPAIFGTLFERSLDPSKRKKLGAHYTSREDILLIVEPVLMAPLRREWVDIRGQAEALIARRDAATGAARTRHRQALQQLLLGFSTKLASMRVLDPACGSGNFLYVVLKALMDLDWEVIRFAGNSGLTTWFPQVTPEQLFGIEVSPYAHELAQVVVWIGYLQWLHDHGYPTISGTILRRLDNIKQQDAILAFDSGGQPVEPSWPDADIIIGNPPFLGGNKIRHDLRDPYVNALFCLYKGIIPASSDLACYWFERTRDQIEKGRAKRAGLLATQGIRGSANRKVLERIKKTGGIFWAQSDRDWVLEGAAVHVSMIGFDDGSDADCMLNDQPVDGIHADLTGAINLTGAPKLRENRSICLRSDEKGGPFDIDAAVAREMLAAPINPNGRPNSDVVRPYVNAREITQRSRNVWIIDFGCDASAEEAALYEQPFEYVRRVVRPFREKSGDQKERAYWWLHRRPAPDMREAVKGLARFIATPRVSKHRVFIWIKSPTIPDCELYVFARDDDYFFGVLHSKPQELWARRKGRQVRDAESGFRYTPTSTFATFPLPWPPGREPMDDPLVVAVAEAACDLVAKRDAWLNPPGASEEDLARRTLTNLYNQRPTWLDLAHRKLDQAVFDAYGWPHDLTGEQILERLLALNVDRAAGSVQQT